MLFDTIKTPNAEAIKEIARWVVFFIISWIITQLLAQINVVPDSLNIKIWEFFFPIPIRQLITSILTVIGRYADKYIYTKTKNSEVETKGILPF